MVTVISDGKRTNHSVEKYNFKVFAIGSHVDKQSDEVESNSVQSYTTDEHPSRRDSDTDEENSISKDSASKDSLVESLLKKTDEMTSNFIKLQMKLEAQEQEHKEELKKTKEESYREGVEAGKAEALKNTESNYATGLTQFSASVATLENSAKEYSKALEGIKSELITAALDISKEVINIELNSSSQNIATVLSSELIKELQSASKITLKVNPKDHGAISEHVGSLEYVEVISDSAVSEGGVIAISDVGNIDAQISKRFERVKKAALGS